MSIKAPTVQLPASDCLRRELTAPTTMTGTNNDDDYYYRTTTNNKP